MDKSIRKTGAFLFDRGEIFMGILQSIFKSRDRPQNATSGSAYRFFIGGSSSGKNVNERSAMQMTAVYSCVRILSEAVASLPLYVYKYNSDGGKEKAVKHPLYFLIHDEPNPEMTSFVFRETLMTHLLLWGNAYAQIIRNGKGEIIALYPLMPNRMTVDRDEKYYEVFYILFHTGLRISEFCGLTIKDIDLKNRIINIDHQLQRIGSMEYHIESTKTNAGTRKLPMTEDVFRMFQAILEDRPTDLPEIMVDGYVGFLFRDKNGMPEVALHWEHRLKNAVNRYNSIFRVQLPKITPHICRHTYCSNQAKAGMNPKTLQYLMGHSDIGVTMNTYTHLGLDDAKDEMIRMEELEQVRKEVDKAEDKKPMKQNMFKVV